MLSHKTLCRKISILALIAEFLILRQGSKLFRDAIFVQPHGDLLDELSWVIFQAGI